MKHASYTALTVLILTISFSSLTYGLSTSPHLKSSSWVPADAGLQVWFDTPYFLEAGPCEYQLVVHAKASSGFTITNLHWDFGDGSILDVPFARESFVSDSRVHGFATARTYVVAVTASDSGGNSAVGYWGISDAFPTSCLRSPQPSTHNNPMTSPDAQSIYGFSLTINAQIEAAVLSTNTLSFLRLQATIA